MKHPEVPKDDNAPLSREIEEIVARQLEPLRDELARLRGHLAALRDSFVPW